MWWIFRKNLKDNRLALTVYIAASSLLSLMYIALFPSISKQNEALMQTMQAYQGSLGKVFEISNNTFLNLGAFLAMENFSIFWPIMIIAMCASFGGGSIAGEIERGTISLLLSQPVSRVKLYAAKYLSGLISLILFNIISILIIIPLAMAFNIETEDRNYLFLLLSGGLFTWAIYSMTMLFSSIFSEKGKVIFFTVGLIVLMYALKILSSLKANLDNLKYFSFFHYFDSSQALADGKIDLLSIIVFSLVIIVCSILGGIVFQKRDIAIS